MTIPSEFEAFYENFYGARWPALLQALQERDSAVARPNGFASEPALDIKLGAEIPRAANGVLQYYVMDPASIAVALSVGVQPGEKILDMCAAPGGKSLILAEAKPEELILNELSQERRQRLKKVLQQYIPRELRDGIHLAGQDGGFFVRSHPGYFDRVLVDAPCSGEGHLLRHPKEMAEWSAKRSAKLAQRQYALLTAALLVTRAEGTVVYSTCALSQLENDEVIRTLIKRKGDQFEVQAAETYQDHFANLKLEAERTEFGVQFLPDRGAGPLFLARLRRR